MTDEANLSSAAHGTIKFAMWVIPYIFLVPFVCTYSCTEQISEGTFRQLNSRQTGISFANTLTPDSIWNIIRFRYFYNGGGVAITDVNGDALPDIFFTGNMVSNRLYLNRGGLRFEDITERAGLLSDRWCTGVAITDINGDQLSDIYVSVSGSSDSTNRRNLLFINQGNDKFSTPRFSEQAQKYGLDDPGYTTQTAFFDYDLDGDLDAYVLTAANTGFYGMDIRKPIDDGHGLSTDKLYRNNGDQTFTEVSQSSGIVLEGFGLGVGVMDINHDHWPDIYVANDYLSSDLLYINQGDSGGIHLGFRDEAARYFKYQSHFSMGMDFGDINNDGWVDLITLDMLPEHYEGKKMMAGAMSHDRFLLSLERGYMPQYMRNMLHLCYGIDEKGTPKYGEIGQLAGIHETDWSWSALLADFDNDGDQDLHISNGFVKDITNMDFVAYDMNEAMKIKDHAERESSVAKIYEKLPSLERTNYLFQNEGHWQFRPIKPAWGPSFSNGAAYGDLDLDGDLELVVSNINSTAFVLENLNIGKRSFKESHYLKIQLDGSQGNSSGIGTKVSVQTDLGLQIQYQYPFRGYQSTVDEVLHFGLGSHPTIHNIKVRWPDGKSQQLQQVGPDQVLTFDYREADSVSSGITSIKNPVGKLHFREITEECGLSYHHKENRFVDFKYQPLLLQQYSQYGPGIAVGDLDGNDWDDVYIGGAFRQSGRVFYQAPDGKFTGQEIPGDDFEDMGSLIFDADQDGDQDLYVVSGGASYPEAHISYQDRIYINQGDGLLTPSPHLLPEMRSSGSCVVGADYDLDGDLDLFVGGRIVPGKYPMPPRSYLLRNEGGKFRDVTATLAPTLVRIGMVSSALWTDFDNDGWMDLIVIGEGMPITILKNQRGTDSLENGRVFHSSKIPHSAGWWNSISGGDFDNDGDIDYLLGNLGLNTPYKFSQEHPMTIYADDFDKSGSIDAIAFYHQKNQFGSMYPFPAQSRDLLGEQLIDIKRRFPRHEDFTRAQLHDILSAEEVDRSFQMNLEENASIFLENLSGDRLKVKELPIAVQVSPVFGIQCMDLDEDNFLDVLLIGNFYSSQVDVGRYGAMMGVCLKGSKDGKLQTIQGINLGFVVEGDAKALTINLGPKGFRMIATRNDDKVSVFDHLRGTKERMVRLKPDDAWLKITFEDGSTRKHECYYGSGYLSQKSRSVYLPQKSKEVKIIDFQGKERIVGIEEIK